MNPVHSSPLRRGFTLTELAIAGVVLAAGMLVFVQVMSAAAATRRDTQDHHWAVQELGNIMERLTTIPWEDLSTEATKNTELAEAIARELPNGSVTISVEPGPDSRNAKRILITMRWETGSGTPREVSLRSWVYRREMP